MPGKRCSHEICTICKLFFTECAKSGKASLVRQFCPYIAMTKGAGQHRRLTSCKAGEFRPFKAVTPSERRGFSTAPYAPVMNAKSESSRYRPQKVWISLSSSHSRMIRASSPAWRFERETAKTILALSINWPFFDQSPRLHIGCTGFVTSPFFSVFFRCLLYPIFLLVTPWRILILQAGCLLRRHQTDVDKKGRTKIVRKLPHLF